MAVKDKFFEAKDAYIFKENEKVSNEFLIEELVHQLRNLEVMWLEVSTKIAESQSSLTQESRLKLENISFRLKEIIRFIKKNEGPKIIEFVCTEIADLIAEKFVMQTMLTEEECKQVSVMLTVINTYFQPDVFRMQIIDFETISNDLKNAMNTLLERLF